MAGQFALTINRVSKSFRVDRPEQSLKNIVINFYKPRIKPTQTTVLKDISLKLKTGEFFGIAGANGDGKSTLLKLIAGIYQPDSGSIEVSGKIVSLIELGAGLQPELTGRDNVYLGTALAGLGQKQTDRIYRAIVDFAELESDMNKKLKNYSSGMQVRLAFAIMTAVGGDIFLIDEVLAVGDEAFRRKCLAHFDQLKRQQKTVILVTHDMDLLVRFCHRAGLLHQQQLVQVGRPKKIAQSYFDLFN